MGDSSETGEISTMRWIPGQKNVSDALTKRNIVMFKKLNKVMTTGSLEEEILEEAKQVRFYNQHSAHAYV